MYGVFKALSCRSSFSELPVAQKHIGASRMGGFNEGTTDGPSIFFVLFGFALFCFVFSFFPQL